MYASLARFGYGSAKSMRPSKVKKQVSKLTSKIPSSMKPKNAKAKKIIEGVKLKAGQGYTKAYDATLGTSTRRKVTTGVIGGGIGFDIFDDD